MWGEVLLIYMTSTSNNQFGAFKRIPMPDLTPRHSDLISLGMGLSNNVFKGILVILTYTIRVENHWYAWF